MKSTTRRLRRAASKGEALRRRGEFLALKDRYALTYQALSDLTGLHLVSLKQWGCGGKPLKERMLHRIKELVESRATRRARGAESQLTA
jgi:hypothetical protein